MPATSALARELQIAVETTSGTAASSGFKKLTAISVAPRANIPTERFRPMGYKFPTQVTPGKEWSESGVEGRACYRHVVYPLSSLFGAATITSPDATNAPTARSWAFALSSTAASVPRTFTAEQTRGGTSARSTYGIFTGMTLNVGRETVEMGGDLIARNLETGITPVAGATELAAQLMVPKSWDLYIDTASGALGTTKVTSAFTAEFALKDRWGPLYFINSAQASFGDVVETEPDATLSLSMLVDSTTDAYLALLRAGTTRYVRLESIGATIGGAITYKFTLDLAVKFEEVGDEGEEEGALVRDINLAVVHDATWGRALQVTVVNDQAAL